GTADYDEIQQEYESNPFFSLPPINAENENKALTNFFQKGISQIGGVNVTTFADGLSQFLIERATEELNVAFFNRFKKFLEKTPEAGVLFPTTADYLGNF